MEWSRDLESGGGGFDSRLPEVGSGSLFRDFSDVLGSVWEGLGDIFRQVWEGFEKMSDGIRTSKFSKLAGSIFLSRGASE